MQRPTRMPNPLWGQSAADEFFLAVIDFV
ncbi:MAG: hypothetical protein QOI88_1833, partial [Gammaproteobacteria bacterium]|nr:hypothetical protein [Gammaproteobacteria bacterium]